ncbi:hypothetical protein [Pedobacter punctiformis]|uniref:Lipoprotein n=1 Tax=Pedobacter punctiformis TaxID=3004097 RepID=A0ABT4LC32_9SPHI|nr:hypothetical protein [Pedobacter sp. HCMS5-2]MCZ4245481.1 hypothetical protein [Pedobacter sp. HCMS5-2]
MNTSNSIKPRANGVRPNQKTISFKLAIFILGLFLSGCASFSDRTINQYKVKLSEENVSRLSGTYRLFPDLIYTKRGDAEILGYQRKTEQFHRHISKNKIDFSPSDNLSVDVKVLENNQISFLFKKDNFLLDSVTLSAKLQSRGLLLLGNKYVKFHGVPYILGGSESAKTRIGLASDGGLILNHAHDRSGALLLFIAAGRSSDYAYHFKRIK